MFIISFDIPLDQPTEKRRINRELHRMGARMLQQSFWEHEDLGQLIKVASSIKSIGGSARILEEKFIF
jgi:uncharacterized protein (UPF0128 family)